MDSHAFARLVIVSLLTLAPASAAAQQDQPATTTADQETQPDDQLDSASAVEADEDAPDPDDEDAGADDEDVEGPAQPSTNDEDDQPASTSSEANVADGAAPQRAPTPIPLDPPVLPESATGDMPPQTQPATSPIADLADQSGGGGFEPLEEIEEDLFESITPAQIFPWVDWRGSFRLRADALNNFDLDTEGTSAVAPPSEAYQPDPAADPDAETHWSTNLRIRLEPTIHLTEGLALHVEADLLNNVVLGTQRASSTPSLIGLDPADDSPALVRINEAWARADLLFLTLEVGRMDDDWGLGIFADDGDCLDCDVETPIDRLALSTRIWELYARATIDFPQEGTLEQRPAFAGQPLDASGADELRQWTLAAFRKPLTREDFELQNQALRGEKRPVVNGGVYLTYRTREGSRTADATQQLYYRGLEVIAPDLWFQLLYNPDDDTYVRVEAEAVGVFGRVDNDSSEPVGLAADNPDLDENLNCFDEDVRNANRAACTTNASGDDVSRDILQFGVALESEVHLGGPVRFGLDGGAASGGDAPSWGLDLRDNPDVSNDAGFYRFHPNYHPDLILFREVIGTVTNAAYFKPWIQARFLESPSRRIEAQFDAIASTALDERGTPARDASMLGVEFDASLRFLQLDRFTAELQGGVLFPLAGLAAVASTTELQRLRVNDYADQGPIIDESIDPSLAWTVQGNLFWSF